MGNLKYESVYSALQIPTDIDDKISSPSLSLCAPTPPSRVSCPLYPALTLSFTFARRIVRRLNYAICIACV
jgi:hypothetical protein